MTWLLELLRRLQFRLRRRRFDEDLAEEMRLHIDLRASDVHAAGMSLESANDAARRQFGNTTRLQEISREAWGWTFLDTLWQDIRYGARSLQGQPGFTATAVLSLALGIGANTAIFSIINAVMLRSLPVEDPQALVQVSLGSHGDGELNTPLWEQIRDNQSAFSGVMAFSSSRFNLADSGDRRYAQGLWVSGGFFEVLGVPAMLGRALTPADDQWGGGPDGPVAVVSYNFWKNSLNSDPGVIGKSVRLNRRSFAIVGVTPPWFRGLDVDRNYEVAIPIGCLPVIYPGAAHSDEVFHWWLRVLGRIPQGIALKQADDQMQAIAPQILRNTLHLGRSEKDQAEYLKSKLFLRPATLGFSNMRVQYRTALFALMAMVSLVLLIACANIANLLLARGAARQRELSLRMAIGASRGRVIRQLMTESLLLAALGAAGGFLLALWGGRILLQLLSTARNPIDIGIAPDLRLLAFTTIVAGLTALLFGLAPAFRSTRFGLSTALKENRLNFGKALVATQVALSLILLIGAALFLGTLRNLLTMDPGFDRRGVLMLSVELPQTTSAQQRSRTFKQILTRLQSIPGVASAAYSVLTPISPEGWAQPTYPQGFTGKSPRETLVFLNRVSAGYFRTMRTPLIAGREFSDGDSLTSPRVMLINQSAARDFFGNANPIGRTIGIDKPGRRGERTDYQVVGVVKDTKYNRLDEQPRRIAYLAGEQDPKPGPSLRYSILSTANGETLAPSLRAALSEVDPDISFDIRTLEAQVNDSLLQPRLVASLSSVFGALALLLAMVGLYGITNYSVARRKREIGIRIAMGAQRRSVISLILRDMALLLALGIALGSAVSYAAGRLVTTLLYGLQPNAPAPLAVAVLILTGAAAVAAYLPARRAAQLDPMAALREQ